MQVLRLFLGSLLLSSLTSAWAISPTVESLIARVEALQYQVAQLQSQLSAAQAQVGALQDALTNETSARLSADLALQAQITAANVAGLQARMNSLETLTSSMTADTNNVYFTGVNVHIRNGLGSTSGVGDPCGPSLSCESSQTNGLGNLVIGYNEAIDFPSSERNGSHNLVVGANNRYTSFGGIVAGYYNEIRAPYATVTAGYRNSVSGTMSDISGGAYGTVTSGFASICGGLANEVSGYYASISGGYGNKAYGFSASVSGGSLRVAPNPYYWAAGALFQDH